MTDLLKQSTAFKTQYLRQSSPVVTLVGQIQSDAGLSRTTPRISFELNTFDISFLVTDANEIKKHIYYAGTSGSTAVNLSCQAPLGGVSRVSHGHTGEHGTRSDVTQSNRFEKLGRRYVDEMLISFG